MARSTIDSHQLADASIIPEFDFDIITAADIVADWQAITAGFTFDIIPYSQFKSETGCNAPHPLANLGQANVLKINIAAGMTGTGTVSNDTICTAFSILQSYAGCFVFLPISWKTEGGANGFRTFFEDGSLSNYIQGRTSVYDVNSTDTWDFCGISADDSNYYVNKLGSPVLSELDHLHISLHTDNTNANAIYITSYFAGAKRKPIFCIEQDDLTPNTNLWVEDCETNGFKTGFNAISINVDSGGGRPTTAEMKTYLDNGHVVYLHGALGLLTLGSSAALIAQFEGEYAFWKAFYPTVLTDTTLKHGALPEGATDIVVREWMRTQGYKTMRRTGAVVYQAVNAQPVFNSNQDYLHLPSLNIDAFSSAAIISHIDLMIEHGIDNVFYLHDYDGTPTRATAQAILAHLKLRQDQGLCDVMPRHEWYEKSIDQYGKRSGA